VGFGSEGVGVGAKNTQVVGSAGSVLLKMDRAEWFLDAGIGRIKRKLVH